MVTNFQKWVYRRMELIFFAGNLKGFLKELQNTLLGGGGVKANLYDCV